ncbi:MAG: ABC transporter ATP-binding protein [Lachnospiraceae bacterium]|nr:ABC transporter ATP-binding protein [Lachnospiraceae bacterium]
MIELKGLTKNFGDFCAVDGVNLRIEDGEFFGLLGPNGAGKTTTIHMLSTLLLPTSGEVWIDGELLTRSRNDLKQKFSLITQEYSLRQDMNMDEIMMYQGLLYHMNPKEIREKSQELLDFCGLTEYRKRGMRRLSGGMKRKLMVCRALLTDPQILFLDEPTAGMDALARRQMWDLLTQLNEQGLTIVLTTHYIEEAEMLCERVAMIEHGRIEEVDTPVRFIERLGTFAVDEIGSEGIRTQYFYDKEEALAFAEGIDGQFRLRDTALEDVFVTMHREKEQG